MKNLIAQVSNPIGSPLNGIGSIGNPGPNPVNILAKVLSTTIGLLTIIGVIYFIFILISGAISMINAGGDKGDLENARKKITTGLIGVIVLIAAIFIMDLIAALLGIPQILDLQQMLNRIRIY
jgi:hypothetical protein